MVELPHAIVGAVIATKVGNPALALPLALGSHFALEFVPHWNPHLNRELKKFGKVTKQSFYFVLGDSLLALIAGSFIASFALPDAKKFLIIMLGAFFAVLPDVIEAPFYFLKARHTFYNKYIPFKKSIQNDTTLLPGLASQIATIIFALWWLFF